MKSDFLYPEVADRSSPDEWAAAGARDIRQAARDRARAILATHFPGHIGADLRRDLRDRFDIRLDEGDMKAG